MKKKIFLRRKNCSNFIFFLLRSLCEIMYIFYEKEVVLRAYVYSSDFINRRDNWSTYSGDMEKGKMLEIAIFITAEST